MRANIQENTPLFRVRLVDPVIVNDPLALDPQLRPIVSREPETVFPRASEEEPAFIEDGKPFVAIRTKLIVEHPGVEGARGLQGR